VCRIIYCMLKFSEWLLENKLRSLLECPYPYVLHPNPGTNNSDTEPTTQEKKKKFQGRKNKRKENFDKLKKESNNPESIERKEKVVNGIFGKENHKENEETILEGTGFYPSDIDKMEEGDISDPIPKPDYGFSNNNKFFKVGGNKDKIVRVDEDTNEVKKTGTHKEVYGQKQKKGKKNKGYKGQSKHLRYTPKKGDR